MYIYNEKKKLKENKQSKLYNKYIYEKKSILKIKLLQY